MSNIYVGNLNFKTTQQDLEDMFGEFGPVKSVRIITDRDSGRSKGFAFVEMESSEDAEKAIEAINGKDIGGRTLKVNEARPREENNSRGPRRGGGGGGQRRY